MALVAGLMLATAAACDRGGSGSASAYASLHEGLCQTRALATEPDAARDVFFDHAHQPLHDLAADAAERDRGAAARLLESKEAVERDLADGASNLPADLDRLVAATRAAISAAGDRTPDECEDTP